MLNIKTALLATSLVVGSAFGTAHAQRGNYNDGLRQGGHGGSYEGRNYDHNDRGYNNDGRYDQHRGGIGAGKGALIGAGGGALLGGLLGGGLKGALIGGAAGGGIGAIAGQEHHNSVQRRDGYYPR